MVVRVSGLSACQCVCSCVWVICLFWVHKCHTDGVNGGAFVRKSLAIQFLSAFGRRPLRNDGSLVRCAHQTHGSARVCVHIYSKIRDDR